MSQEPAHGTVIETNVVDDTTTVLGNLQYVALMFVCLKDTTIKQFNAVTCTDNTVHQFFDSGNCVWETAMRSLSRNDCSVLTRHQRPTEVESCA